MQWYVARLELCLVLSCLEDFTSGLQVLSVQFGDASMVCMYKCFLFAFRCSMGYVPLLHGGTEFVAGVSVVIVFALFVLVGVRSLNDPRRVTARR